MSTSILLCGAVASPTAGRLSDIFGRRNFLLLGNISGIAGCAIAATADAAGRNIIIGAGGLIGIASSQHQLAWAGLAEVGPRRSRGLALGLFQCSLFPAAAFGPIVGKFLVATLLFFVSYSF